LRGKVAERGAFVSEEHYNQVRADVVLKVKEAYFSLYWVDRVIQISQDEKEVLRRLARISQKKYETGLANQQDILKAQLEISKVEDRILGLSQGRRAIASQLNALMNRHPDEEIPAVEELDIFPIRQDVEELYRVAEERRPELRKVRRVIERNQESLKLAKKNYYPDFVVMFDYIDIGGGSTDHPRDGGNAWMGSVGVSIPLWRKKLHAAKAEARLRLEASRDVYSNIQNETLSKINELYHEAKTAEEQVRLYKHSLLPQAEQAFKASEVGYLAGEVDFLNLLDSERMILTIKTGYHKAVADYHKSLSRLERIVGRDLVEDRESHTVPIRGQ
jgi:outer membrane protein TolC